MAASGVSGRPRLRRGASLGRRRPCLQDAWREEEARVRGAGLARGVACPWLLAASLEVLASVQRGSRRFRGARDRGESSVAYISGFRV